MQKKWKKFVIKPDGAKTKKWRMTDSDHTHKRALEIHEALQEQREIAAATREVWE